MIPFLAEVFIILGLGTALIASFLILLAKTEGRSLLYFWAFLAATSCLLVILGAEILGFMQLLFTFFCLYCLNMHFKKAKEFYQEPLQLSMTLLLGALLGIVIALPLFTPLLQQNPKLFKTTLDKPKELKTPYFAILFLVLQGGCISLAVRLKRQEKDIQRKENNNHLQETK
ncbi:MAG: hypothetical protein D6785_07105 [Planctomycetota bacterium]|nr:MAG: hypothetical protein D6785_07105 [Planctomycetota bacterium]